MSHKKVTIFLALVHRHLAINVSKIPLLQFYHRISQSLHVCKATFKNFVCPGLQFFAYLFLTQLC